MEKYQESTFQNRLACNVRASSAEELERSIGLGPVVDMDIQEPFRWDAWVHGQEKPFVGLGMVRQQMCILEAWVVYCSAVKAAMILMIRM